MKQRLSSSTGLADKIRRYVLDHYIEPARESGQLTVTIRAGDVHKEMGLQHRMPNVCNALDAKKFEPYARVRLVKRQGPNAGANVYFTLELD